MSPPADRAAKLRHQLTVFESGERFEVLVDCSSRLPLFHETLYLLETHRSRHNATATMQNCNTALQAMHLALAGLGIEIESRLATGEPLLSRELTALARQLRLPIGKLREKLIFADKPAAREFSVRGARLRLPKTEKKAKGLIRAVADDRLKETIAYLDWRYAHEAEFNPTHAQTFKEALTKLERFKKLYRTKARRSSIGLREGLSRKVLARLHEAIQVDVEGNPWRQSFCQVRNEIVVLLGLVLGLRIGEILGLCLSDFSLVHRRVTIRRRADDPEDSRTDQPNAKTRDRILAMSEELTRKIENYIISRSELSESRCHEFLIVSAHGGRPLSKSAAKKIYQTLRSNVADLPDDLSSHVARHTFNDALSDLFDSKGVPEGKEIKLRNYSNGWSEQSKSAEIYTRRHTRRKANEVSLELQKRSMPKKED